MSFFDGCPGSKRIREPFPENIKCMCGKEVEIWSDETETVCPQCKKRVDRNMPQSCLDWCSMAKECIGLEKFKKYKKHKNGKES
ncbi:phosphohydrolase [Candidatus Omnitrophota bacterium]